MASVVRSTALRAGGACVRCRKGKTKCVYENGRAPCKNCAKGMHECYLPSESMSHGGHGVSPARVPQRPRESLPSERVVSSAAVGDRQPPAASAVSRHVSATSEKYVFHYFDCSIFRSLSLCLFMYFMYFLYVCFVIFLFFTFCTSGRSVSKQPFPARSRLLHPPDLRFLASPLGGDHSKPHFSPPGPQFPKPAQPNFSLAPCTASRLTPICLAFLDQTEPL